MSVRKIILVILAVVISGGSSHTSALASSNMAAPLHQYYVAVTGSDSNPGTLAAPWRTVQKALDSAAAGDLIYVRGGQYNGTKGGWVFKNSGTASLPITITNYPGEQAVFKITAASDVDRNIFRCSINPTQPPSWWTPKADYIHILATDVSPRMLSNGVKSQKGIVMQGMEGEQSAAIIASDCDHWEVAGVDFIETAYGIFTHKNNWHREEEHSTDHWHVHDNRVYIYYRESGMQFDGNHNLVENNQIYKVSDRLDTPHGCQMLNLLGNNNIVRGNIFSRGGSHAECTGILFEWDLSDANLIEHNSIIDVPVGIAFQGGDGNIIRDNLITSAADTNFEGIHAASYNNQITWPCDDYVNSGSSAEALLPPNNPSHPDYRYYYNPRNCHSMNNQVIDNTILGFREVWIMYPVADYSNVFANNSTLGVTSITLAPPASFPAANIDFIVRFSQPVIGVNADGSDFDLAVYGITGASISAVSGSGRVYTVSVFTGSGYGSIRLDIPAGATITDTAGNPIHGLPFSYGDLYEVEVQPIFSDVPSSHWAWQYVESLANAGITGGCGGGNYCPNNPVTRVQMALFLLKGTHGSGYTPPAATGTVFNDVGAGDFAAAWIEQLAAEGISTGCGGGNYCPNGLVTRAQMAVFLLRAEHGFGYTPPAATGTMFTDVGAGDFAAAWIEQLANEAITTGCGGGNYCPSQAVTRAQMAVFLVRIFNLP